MNFLFHLHLSILILHSISQLESRKLTEEENQKRLEVCGLTTIPKIFNGRETSVNEAPWSVMVHTSKENQQYGHCTGTLISPRHILTATHCSASGDKEEWSSAVGKPLNREKCLENDNFIVTEVGASKVTVRSRNETIIGRAKYLFMFQLCRKIEKSDYEYLFPDDFMIVELSEDIEYSQNLQPACLARDTTDNELGTKLDFFGYGDNPPPGVVHSPEPKFHVTPKLLHQKIFVTEFTYEGNTYQTDSRVFMAQSVTSKTIACPGDSGGGAIRNIDGRNTVVGVAMQGTCAKLLRGKDGFEVYASVGYYREDVCEKTGICTPPRDSSDGNLSLEYVLWANGVRRDPWSKMNNDTIDFLKKMLNPCVEARATIEQVKEDPWLVTDVRPIRSVKRRVIGNKNGDVQGMETRTKRQRLDA
ncbi:hypothetical protein CAEBREN_22372 [Caenorhabditis brenneri]|uniref:Peptidase S1 domain-containing protein n=1 Tax=Caenorhabditis brenneri TaxID=135651 RepID=G0NWI9_CAEBE|nr:hypothetical protein CAEBREN_22372 [Caenorhabditis brenneri]